jgi:succinoglycan biosynthesis transport protein ExoP
LVLLLVTPLILAGLVTYYTRNPNFKYASETTLYTGIASGSSVEMDKSLSFFATNTAFDNLINVIKSRETQQEAGLRLLSQHLLMDKAIPTFISAKSLNDLRELTPAYVKKLVVRTNGSVKDTKIEASDTLNNSFSFTNLNDLSQINALPASVNVFDYEQTVKNLTDLMMSSDTNFIYKLLNFENPHYSIKAISSINVQRISSSDLVRLKYEADDPGICRQTLVLLTEICIKNYKNIKENRSDAVVKYFEFQLKQAAGRLKVAEDKLLEFNKSNNIINYYEQSKAVAVVKEDLDVEYHNKRIALAGIEASIKRLEEKLGNQEQIQLKSTSLIDKRNMLGLLSYKISSTESMSLADNNKSENLADMKAEAERLKDEIKIEISDLYTHQNSLDGLPIASILNDWIKNVIEAENIKAGIEVLGDRIKEFQKQYAIYAPAGANIKRIEREISVSEQEFLEILHGLNLAKLKMQDNELSSNIKAVDEPFFPLSPIPTKRKILIVVAGFLGFMIVMVTILVLEYFDTTLKNLTQASKILKLSSLGVLPKILLKFGSINFPFITNRLLEIIIQNIELYFKESKSKNHPKTLLFFSTLSNEGKSVVMDNLAMKLKRQGNKVLVLKFSRESLRESEISQSSFHDDPPPNSNSVNIVRQQKASIVSLLLGYPDTRINFESPFLNDSKKYLSPEELFYYQVEDSYYTVKNYLDILKLNNISLSYAPDYIFIEIPPILYYSYPIELVSNVDIPILVCRSNRVWTGADQGVLDVISKLTIQKISFILNGVELPVVESVLGDLPRKRSWLRQIVKNIFRFQFFSKNQL